MRKYVLIFAILIAACFIFSGCQKEKSADDSSKVQMEGNNQSSKEGKEIEKGEEEQIEKQEQIKKQVVLENEAFQVSAPVPNQKVNGTIIVEGKARVFEASFQYRLEDGHMILAEGAVMADQGAPEWGDFKFEIRYKGATSPTAVLSLFEASPKDGSVQHELLIPLQLENYQ